MELQGLMDKQMLMKINKDVRVDDRCNDKQIELIVFNIYIRI